MNHWIPQFMVYSSVCVRRSSLACQVAMDAVKMVTVEENGRKEIDIKRYARVEKVPGGSIEDSHVLRGVMLNKDVVHAKMRRWVGFGGVGGACAGTQDDCLHPHVCRRIENPRIVLLDCPLEYKKGESMVRGGTALGCIASDNFM